MNDPLPLCSVIVPVYKHERWLHECLESVRLQTYPRLELIVIDDHSPDGSFDLARDLLGSDDYGRRFSRIVCQRNDSNEGAHSCLNTGIGLSRGEYLFLLNSDDRYHPARIGRMVAEMREANARFAFSAISLLSMAGGAIPPALRDGLANFEFRAPYLPSLSFAFLQFNCTVTTGNFALRRDLARQVGPFVDLKLTHDWDYALRSIVYEEPLYVADSLYEYRLHPTNTFAAVADRAHVETQICLRRYLAQVAIAAPPNRMAPCELNWPLTFMHYLDLWHLTDVWDQLVHGHAKRNRTAAA